ncbi:basic amino acid ABC transporter substrate-binding protein [Anaerosinus massiliensis]|uniref:basic amino acid ABC transporter substrate-binding protein n=1 Tax=Massilibacillus massiliensis TaxID=1806837 RepID=UPI000AF5ADD1|nr:basic amino acid ABC transporter substrate-binding protein [Massilibacillus massiliensis]
MSKKIMSLLVAGIFILSAFVVGCGGQKEQAKEGQGAAEKVLRVGCNADFAPFEFQDVNGKEYVGFDMDLIRAVGKEMGYEVKIQNINFDGLIPAMEAGNIDVIISGMTITEERANKVQFSKPYYQSGLTIAVKTDNQDIQSFKDLEGKSIAVQIGTTGAMEAKKIKDAKVKEFNSSADTFMELKIGGVEAVVNDRPVNDYYLAQGGSKEAKVLSEILTAEDYGIAVSKKNQELAKQIDAALDKLKENGEYDKIYTKWFGAKK